MVISLDAVRIVGDLVKIHFSDFEIPHFSEFLNAIAALYWHARSFNGNVQLRESLFDKRFMRFQDDVNRLPNLLEQEVLSLSKLLEISLALYSDKSAEFQNYAESWVHG